MGSRPINENGLLDLVERIYDAPGGSDGWRGALEALTAAFGGTWAQILVTDFWGQNKPLSDVHPWDPDALSAYVEHYFNLDPRRPALSKRRLKVWVRQDVIDDEVFRRSEIYNDFLVGIGAEQCLVTNVTGFKAGPNFLTVMRNEAGGTFTAEERKRLQLLAGHIDQAVVLHRTLARTKAEALTRSALLDALPVGVLLLGANGRVRQMNRAAADILRAGDGIAVDRTGRPHAAVSVETRRLDRLVGLAVETSQGHGLRPGGVMAVTRPSGEKPYALRVLPLGPRDVALGNGEVVAAVLIGDPERKPEPPAEMLQHLHRLTPAEARLAAALAAGERLNDIADRFGVTKETARSQLKAVFAKTGANGQADLVRVVLSGPAGVVTR